MILGGRELWLAASIRFDPGLLQLLTSFIKRETATVGVQYLCIGWSLGVVNSSYGAVGADIQFESSRLGSAI